MRVEVIERFEQPDERDLATGELGRVVEVGDAQLSVLRYLPIGRPAGYE